MLTSGIDTAQAGRSKVPGSHAKSYDRIADNAQRKEAHYTRREIRERVMVQILAEKIQGRVIAGVRPKEESQAFSKFVKEYEERWQSRTVCAEDHATERCSTASDR